MDARHPVDVHVGIRIRLQRKAIGVSQEKLAETIGLTFQQVQKYEKGANRVSASKLWEIAQALSCTTDFFFVGLTPTEDGQPRPQVQGDGVMLALADMPWLAQIALLEPRERAAVRRLVLALLAPSSADDEPRAANGSDDDLRAHLLAQAGA